MPTKRSTEGFIKGLQRTKYIRHRDVKLKESEIKKEGKIQRVMCEGICPRCREKVQWRFQYDKYKPLKNVATCQGCRQKCVTKAYRTYCDPCATQRKACASCCGDLATLIEEDMKRKQDAAAQPEPINMDDKESSDQEDDMDANSDVEIDMEGEEIPDREVMTEDHASTRTGEMSSWGENNYVNVISSKYSKNRQVGSSQDSVFAFKVVNDATMHETR